MRCKALPPNARRSWWLAAGQPAAPPAKQAEASGTKISGYAVQVINKEGKVVAESFLESGYKQLVGSDGNKPGPLFKKPEAEPAAQ